MSPETARRPGSAISSTFNVPCVKLGLFNIIRNIIHNTFNLGIFANSPSIPHISSLVTGPLCATMDAASSPHKTRIISHMNKDHTREITYYLRHYARASARAASSPEMRDLDFQGMKITARGGDFTVPFEPPLAGWAEAKGRIIEMAHTAREALGLSDIIITSFKWPEGFGMFVFGAVIFYFCCAASLPWVVPGSPAWPLLEAAFPGGAEGFCWTVKTIFWPVIGIHVIECSIFDGRLKKHGVERFSGVWWAWELGCFLEGYPSFKRIDGIIAQKTAEKNAKKQ